MDNFSISTMTPPFFVECLASREKTIRSKGTPEQIVGSLADRTPESRFASQRATSQPQGNDSIGLPNEAHLLSELEIEI